MRNESGGFAVLKIYAEKIGAAFDTISAIVGHLYWLTLPEERAG
jgi:hypothetical protein